MSSFGQWRWAYLLAALLLCAPLSSHAVSLPVTDDTWIKENTPKAGNRASLKVSQGEAGGPG